jgi:hypothetical protein
MLSRLKKERRNQFKIHDHVCYGKNVWSRGVKEHEKKLLSIETINSVQQSHLKTQEENFCRQNIPNSDSLTFKGIIID